MFTLTIPAFAEVTSTESSFTFDIEENGVHTTGAVLVENGIPRRLTKNEYLKLSTQEYVQKDMFDVKSFLQLAGTSPRAYLYSFSPRSRVIIDDYSLQRRVSPIYANVSSISVTMSTSFTRTVEHSGGITITNNILSSVDRAVEASYEYSSSSSSATGSSVSGTFEPPGEHLYAAVVFTPRTAIIEGVLTESLSAMGSSGVVATYNCSFKYPVSVGNYLDGIYAICESDTTSGFPDVA